MKQKIVKMIGGIALLSTIPLSNILSIKQENNLNQKDFINKNFLGSEDKITDFEAGGSFSGVLMETDEKTQELWMWGHNKSGQLGNGTYESNDAPTKVDTSKMLDDENDRIVDFASSDYKNSIALVENPDKQQELWMWGNNSWGQLGNGTYRDSNTPTKVDTSKMLNDEDDHIIDFSLSNDYVGAIVDDGKQNQEVWMWGNNDHAFQLENGSYFSSNVPVKTDTYKMLDEARDQIIDLKTSDSGSALLIENPDGSQEIWKWGFRYEEDGTEIPSDEPIKINLTNLLDDPNDRIIDYGMFWALVQTQAGKKEIWTFGANGNGQLGDGTYEDNWINPIKVDTSLMYDSVEDRIIAVKSNGSSFGVLVQKEVGNQELWMWGNNSWGQLGNGTNTNSNTPVKVNVSRMLNENEDWIVDYNLGEDHTGAIVQNANGSQEIWMWGNNDGQFGNNIIGSNSSVPLMVATNDQENSLYWVTKPTYNLELNKVYGEFQLKNYSNSVKLIHKNEGNNKTEIIEPQYNFSTQNYNFVLNPFVHTNSYYYEFEQLIIEVNKHVLTSQELLVSNFDANLVIKKAKTAYVSSNMAIITFKAKKKLLNWMEANGFTISMRVNGKHFVLSHEEIEGKNVALMGLNSKTDYAVEFYINDANQNSYLNTSVSFTTK